MPFNLYDSSFLVDGFAGFVVAHSLVCYVIDKTIALPRIYAKSHLLKIKRYYKLVTLARSRALKTQYLLWLRYIVKSTYFALGRAQLVKIGPFRL